MKQILNTESKEAEMLKNELNTVERVMYKSLMNNPEENVERRWKRGHGYFLVGRKITNPNNGDCRITFENLHIPKPLKPKTEEKTGVNGKDILSLIEKKVTDVEDKIRGLQAKRAVYLGAKQTISEILKEE